MTFANGGQRDENNPRRRVTSGPEGWDAYIEAGNSAVGKLPTELQERIGDQVRSHAQNMHAWGMAQHLRGGVGRYMGSIGEGRAQSAFLSPESTGGGASDSVELQHTSSNWKDHLLGHAVAYLPKHGARDISEGVELHRLSDYTQEHRDRKFGHLPGYAAFSTEESLRRNKPEIG